MNANAKKHKDLLLLAENAARLAGDYLLKNRNSLRNVTNETLHDVKLNADRESEKIIIDVLKSQTDFPILSEEIGFISSIQETSFQWIVDPLDGTVNYLEGLPICCVSISLWENNHPLIGVIYDFLHANIYRGIVDVGAWLNDEPIHVKNKRPLNQSILCTGFPISMDFSYDSLKNFIKNIGCFKKIRLFGSAAMSLAFVASGRADAYYEKRIKIWDVAAGLALVKAAGGIIDVQYQSSDGIVDAYAGTEYWMKSAQSKENDHDYTS